MAVSKKPPFISPPRSQDYQERNTREDAANDTIAEIARQPRGIAEHEVERERAKVYFVIDDPSGLV